MRIVVMNCNTSSSMTATIAAGARKAARIGTEIIAEQPDWGPVSAEGWYDSFITAAAVLDRFGSLATPFDAAVMAGFGEHGREGVRELLDVPVVDITEAAAHLAMLLGHRYAVVTTLPRSVGQIEDSLRSAGLLGRCAAVVATNLGVLELEGDPGATADAFISAARQAISVGAEAIVLGCAGMSGIEESITRTLHVPVVDGVGAAVAMAEDLVNLGLATSKVNSYAAPLLKDRPGWPPRAVATR
ncbi:MULTISPECIES: aspartate/glutamate racemase family protein [Rhodococcus]|uniref:aspartate/glutamate racemase family protein n=1 Tax=Rhodococcus globerulus TaxID=33008 RepID=UPI001C55CC9A|nr:aspartate/glutamate racemase family protein [Rhodococcus globerulus]QXW04964.1 Asp/Glu/hydantoin racemase [Rhodococcus globerulus]